MRYNAEHKEMSRNKIIEAARKQFRRRGFDGASIDQVMNAAGLTRGAFYAYFDSKDDLVREVLGIEAGLVRELRRAGGEGDPIESGMDVLSTYLDPDHRTDNVEGCPLVAHPVDAIRGTDDLKSGYTDQLSALIQSVGDILGGGEAIDDAVRISVLAVGAGLLSGSCADPDLADRIEAACLDLIREIVLAHAPVQ